MKNATHTHYRACNLCEAVCGIQIEMAGDEIVSIRGDEKDPFSKGFICPKAVALQDIYKDPNRLKHPIRRTERGWERVSWEAAFDEAAARIKAVQQKYGRNAVAVYQGNPSVHSYGSLLFSPRFIKSLRTQNRYSATSADQLPHHMAAYFMFGNSLLLPIPDIDRTNYFLILGANPAASNGSLMTAPDVGRRIKAIVQRGGQVVLLDPRRTETAELVSQHIFIRPGADVWFLLGLLHVVFEENRCKTSHVSAFTDGMNDLAEWVKKCPPDQMSDRCGVPAETIRQIARDFSDAQAAVCYGRMGASTQEHGTLCQWLIQVLNIVSGNLDRPGGAMFTRPAVDILRSGGRGSWDRWRTRARSLPEFGGELPVAALAEEMNMPGEGQIKALITSAGNPALSAPEGPALEQAMEGLDFMLSIDFYLNETTRHAHLILPPTSPLERDHYDLVFHALGVRNTAKYSPPLFKAAPEARHDWQIFHALWKRLYKGDWRHKIEGAIYAWLAPKGLLDLALRQGSYGSGFLPWKKGLNLKALKKSKHGIDLGPLEPCLPQRLFTRNRRIHLNPPLFIDGLSELLSMPAETSPGPAYSLQLIGRRYLRSNNSWMHNSLRLVKGRDRCTLMIHPDDAARRGIENGALIEVISESGAVRVKAEISDEIMPGVVSLPHGWGHTRPGTQLDVAQQHPGVSINDLTAARAVDRISGNAAFSGIWVEARPA